MQHYMYMVYVAREIGQCLRRLVTISAVKLVTLDI